MMSKNTFVIYQVRRGLLLQSRALYITLTGWSVTLTCKRSEQF